MKKIINGKMYNTETSKEYGEYHNTPFTSDYSYYTETLYRKRTREFFLYGKGNAASKYRQYIGNCSMAGERIIVLSEEEARQWVEAHLDAEVYNELFGVAEDEEESNAEDFKELRKRTGLNQKEFAEKFEIPYRTYQRWEEEGAEKYKYTLIRYAVEYESYLNCIDQRKDGKFYIIRNEYHTQNFLYGTCYTLAETLKAIHDDIEKGIELNDVAIEFCKGTDILNYEVTKTMFYHGRKEN